MSKNIIFFHGFGSSNQTDKFQCIEHESKRCVSVDYVALGVHSVFELYEDMILESMRKYDQTILVGHSFGAYFANAFAVKYGLRALLIAPCMQPNLYLADRFPEINHYNFAWDTAYSNNVVVMVENDDECFDVESDLELLMGVSGDYLRLYRFDGGHHRICREEVINQEINELLNKPMAFHG